MTFTLCPGRGGRTGNITYVLIIYARNQHGIDLHENPQFTYLPDPFQLSGYQERRRFGTGHDPSAMNDRAYDVSHDHGQSHSPLR